MLIVFVSGIDRLSPRAGCITVGVLIHYFTLVAWMWMGAEAVLMFQKLVIVFSNITWRYLLAVSIVCWGKLILVLIFICLSYIIVSPLLPVVITVGVDPDFYITINNNNNNTLSEPSGL